VLKKLLAIDGGDKHNAIPREASALLAVPAAAADAAHAAVDAAHAAFRAEYGLRELHGSLALRPAAAEVAARAGAPLDADSTARLLGALIAIPHGPLKYSHAIPGLVETSNNLAAVATAASAAHVLCSSRSSVGPAMEGVRDKLRAVARTLGQGAVEFSPAYPGWQPNPRSRVLALAKEALVELLAREGVHEPPPVLAIHAGLECGLIGEKCSSAYGGGPGAEMDMVRPGAGDVWGGGGMWRGLAARRAGLVCCCQLSICPPSLPRWTCVARNLTAPSTHPRPRAPRSAPAGVVWADDPRRALARRGRPDQHGAQILPADQVDPRTARAHPCGVSRRHLPSPPRPTRGGSG
jgi:hypothetical protein